LSKMDFTFYLLRLVRLDSRKLSRIERILLEIKLFTCISKELQELFKRRYENYLRLIKSNQTQEHSMLDINLPQEVINDILSTEEYSLSGIATHIRIPEEVLSDIASGLNTNPTFESSRKLFELHITVRRDLYDTILRKIISEYLETT
jgi:hypothetical protein